MLTPRYLTPGDIAERYGCRDSKVIGWIKSGELRAIDTSSRRGAKPRWKISPEALAAFEAARASQPAPATPARKQRRQPAAHVMDFV
jgi:hypothetical protein